MATSDHRTRIGILALFYHYPVLDPAAPVDRRLTAELSVLGFGTPDFVVYDLTEGAVPPTDADVAAWIVSGASGASGAPDASKQRLLEFLRFQKAFGVAVYGMNLGEHALHAAFCPEAPAPETRRWPMSVRNPFRAFTRHDRFFAFDPAAGRVVPLPRLGQVVPRSRLPVATAG
ncbi:MAG: hypothetical protein AAFX00_03305 [Pseudomonadota bacterium]